MVRAGDLLGAVSAVALSGTKVLKLKGPDDGVPSLNVLYTSDPIEAEGFMKRNLDSSTLGLDMTWKAHAKGEPYSRSSLIQIAANRSVLIFDLLPKPESGNPPKYLSQKVCGFMQMTNRSFYDIAMPIHAARMAFELNCVIPRGVDLAYEAGAWQERRFKADNIVSLGNRVLRTSAYMMSPVERGLLEERPLTAQQLRYVAARAYLSWAVAENFLRKYGSADRKAFVTKTDMYAAGELLRSQGMPERRTRFDWSKVKAEFLKKKRASAKKSGKDESPASSLSRRQRGSTSPTMTVGSGEVAIAAKEFSMLKRRDAERKKRAAEKAEVEAAAAAAAEETDRKKTRAASKKQKAAKKAQAGVETKTEQKKRVVTDKKAPKVAQKAGVAASVVAAEEFAALKKREAGRKRRAAEKAAAEAEAAAAVAREEAKREKRRERKAAKKAEAEAEAARAAKAAAKEEIKAKTQQRLLRKKNLASRKAIKSAQKLTVPLSKGKRVSFAAETSTVKISPTGKVGKKAARKSMPTKA